MVENRTMYNDIYPNSVDVRKVRVDIRIEFCMSLECNSRRVLMQAQS